MNAPRWIEIRANLDAVPVDWSIFADALDAHGCPGSLIEGTFIVGYLPEVVGSQGIANRLRDALLSLGANSVDVRSFEEQNWTELWKVHFKPRRVGSNFVIRPTWEDFEARAGDVEIVLDPGQAFGTGDHPTTRLCLRLLELAEPRGKSVADIGCGSGVLAIGAARLGAHVRLASDLDPLSVEVTRENARRNGVEFPLACAAGFDALNERVQIAMSNIISATLIRLAPDAAAHVEPGGSWIVSGIIAANWPDVEEEAVSCGFELDRMEAEDEWVGATFRR